MNRDEVLRDALTAVNGIRQDWGLEPLSEMPKGHFRNAAHCPVARALSNGHVVTVASMVIFWGEVERITMIRYLPTPPSISRFVRAFDKQQYPELIERW